MGCDITIIKRSAQLRTSGQQLGLSGQGITIMEIMGIRASVRAIRCPEPGMRLLDHRGRSKAFFPAGKTISPTRELEVMRWALVQILYEATKSIKRAKYVFDSYIKEFTQDDLNTPSGKVHVTFPDGKQDDYDVLIGADGIGLATRKLLLGPSFPDPRRELGVTLAYFTAPSREDDCYDWTICHIPGGKVIITRKDRPENIRVYLATRTARAALDPAKTVSEQKAILAEPFRGFEGCKAERFMRDLLEALEADDLYCQAANQIQLLEGVDLVEKLCLLVMQHTAQRRLEVGSERLLRSSGLTC